MTLLKGRVRAAKLGANAERNRPCQLQVAQIYANIECIYNRFLAEPIETASTLHKTNPPRLPGAR